MSTVLDFYKSHIGTVIFKAGATTPTGYLLCNGAAVSRTTYANLFAEIGTTWGAGDGTTTFNVPDLRGRCSIAAGTGAGLSARTLAATGGEEAHTLSVGEMPSHNHGGATGAAGAHTHQGASNVPLCTNPTLLGAAGSSVYVANGVEGTDAAPNHTHGVSSQGGGSAHNVMQPFAVLNAFIKF